MTRHAADPDGELVVGQSEPVAPVAAPTARCRGQVTHRHPGSAVGCVGAVADEVLARRVRAGDPLLGQEPAPESVPRLTGGAVGRHLGARSTELSTVALQTDAGPNGVAAQSTAS